MRRLLFNPLAQEPYASGKYDQVNKYFYIDRALETGFYTYLIVENDGSGQDTIHNGNIYFETKLINNSHSTNIYYGNSTNIRIYVIDDGEAKQLTATKSDGSFLDSGIQYTIYLYKVY